MASPRDSWVNAYEHVDFDVPIFKSSSNILGKEHERAERQAMLPPIFGTTKGDSASSPSATSSPHIPPSSSTSSGTLVASGSSSSNLFGFASSVSSSSSNTSPQFGLGALGTNDTAATPPSEKTGQLSSQAPTSGRSPRSSSFKHYPSSPLAASSPSGSNSNTIPQYAGQQSSSQAPVTGSASFARHASRSDGFNASASTSVPPSTSISTDRTSPNSLVAPSSFPSRGSMILYRLSGTEDGLLVPPPGISHPSNRGSTYSISADSIVELAGGSKYPTLGQSTGGLIAYVYDPDEDDDDDEDAWLHDKTWASSVSLRGFTNITTLVALIAALLCLFIVLPVAKNLSDNGVAMKILGNTRINATGQAVEGFRREFSEELIVVRFAPEGR
ncbi:hypothetical protein M413DRAFT_19987 [Hebeloma cylindrosporum]|uniref:Uncharacterized protein n=1 Tax=Hebeloma cylindrosporum TaxID=76867 RepID=A0A0C2XL30_HEBCY|nr:hypothetical protein M413DRAFT_19987 [Hebeloma cylindrosporum h7]